MRRELLFLLCQFILASRLVCSGGGGGGVGGYRFGGRFKRRTRRLFAPVAMRRTLVSVHREPIPLAKYLHTHPHTSSVVGWCLTRSFFVQLFPRALVHLSLCIRHLPFPSAAHPPSQPVPCAQSPASRSCWLAVNVTVVPPIAITPILFCRPHGPRTHTPFLFCSFVASQLVSLSSFAITSAPLLPFLPPTSCTHRRWFAPKDKMTTKTMKTTRECRRWTKMRCIHHSTRGRSARVLLFVLSVSLSRITPARAPSPCPATTAINRHHRHHSLHRL